MPLRSREPKRAQTPHRLGRFELVERIGQGGMAEVFRAVVTGPEGFRREIVVKRVLPQLSARQRFTQMFVNEAKISALLAHPNIVQIFEFGEADGSYFIAMESIRGLTLREALTKLREQGATMPVVTAAEITREVLVALDYAHGLRDASGRPLEIIHRDVSPSNIMLGETGAVKVLDFGIARAADMIAEDDGDVVKGKIAYVAPEQIACKSIDRRADLFALGCVLHEMLTGRMLFRAQNNLQRKLELLAERSLPPSAWNPDVPPAVDEIVRRAVERDPEARYSSAADMLVDVENYLASFRSSHRAVLRLVRSLGAESEAAVDTPDAALPRVASQEPPQTASTVPHRPGGRLTGAAPRGAPGAADRSLSGQPGAPSAGAEHESAAGPRAPGRLGSAADAERERFARAKHGRRALGAASWLGGLALVAGAALGVRAFVVRRPSLAARETSQQAAVNPPIVPAAIVLESDPSASATDAAPRRKTPDKPRRKPGRAKAMAKRPPKPKSGY